MRIVHFSDIHVGRLTHDPTAFFDKRLLGMMNFLVRRRGHLHPEFVERALARIKTLEPDIVLCTGDVTCVGCPEEFDEACLQLEPLVRKSATFDFYYVPGNHDNYVACKRCRDALEKACLFLNQGRKLADFPFKVKKGDLELFLVDEACPNFYHSSNGKLSVTSEYALQCLLKTEQEKNGKRMLIGHFPTADAEGKRLSFRRRLKNDLLIQELLQKKCIDVTLCGHIHKPFKRSLKNGALEVCAGSLTMTGVFSVIDYCPQTGTFKQFWEKIEGIPGTATPATATLLSGS